MSVKHKDYILRIQLKDADTGHITEVEERFAKLRVEGMGDECRKDFLTTSLYLLGKQCVNDSSLINRTGA